MTIAVLLCHADGTQELVEREVGEDYFSPAAPEGGDDEADAAGSGSAAE